MPTGAGELRIQKDEILPFICREEANGGLGYRETANNIVSPDLFIPSHLAEFVKSAAPDVWARLVRRHHGDERELTEALKADVKSRILESPNNNAVFFNKNNSISFEGERVPLFIPSGSELSNDDGFRKNIFAAVEEMSHDVVCDGVVLQRVRPDISFFLNGIFIGYMELKSVTNGQNAAVKGRGKVIGDYLESVRGMAARSVTRPQVLEKTNRIQTLYLFEKGIHLTASDVNETYVLRTPGQFFDEAAKGFVERTVTIATLRPEVEKVFKPYPVSSALLTNKGKFTEVMHALYGKKSIEKEILYYNFVQYKYERRGRRKETYGGHGLLISPRPKQKFGCDKVLNRVREMLSHEAEPEFYRNKLKVELEALLPGNPERVQEILAQRDLYCNNKFVYSLLLQYAAGFGKSNIIGWTALQLKNLRHEGGWAFDKIMIVVDRLQLRDQLDTMMQSMNISKAMFTEVRNQAEFVRALADLKRILVVNIQKFGDLRKSLEESNTQLGRMRVAFLIDEIHRSNTGESHREMVNIFEVLQDAINSTCRSGGTVARKKNLIVGFTATPTEKVLARFGEFKSASIIPTWVPFDAYTMREAIDDGYILDPTKHIIAVQKTMQFTLPPDVEPESERAITLEKAAVYKNEARMEELAQFIVNRLVSTVYPRIRGTAKGMLAVSSIPNAISYCQRIRRLFAQKCEEPMYHRFKDAPISIVYSDNQENESCASMNGGDSEEKVIQGFRQAKNGLMIVVDKLQTGFDEPKLHTLFLDKEIRDIVAIQTISRVDRTCKYKEECHIVDLSWRNVNVANIKEAFRKYEKIVVSGFNPEQEAMRVDMLYRLLGRSEPFVRWFEDYKRRNNEAAFMLQMEDGVRNWIRVQFERTAEAERNAPTDEEFIQVVNAAKELRANVGEYGQAIEALEDVFDIDPKYRAPLFISFWLKYCNIYRDVVRILIQGGNGPTHPVVDVGDDVPGITIVDDPPEEGEDEGGGETGLGGGDFVRHRRNVWDVLLAWNEIEQLSKAEKEKWLEEIGKLFEWLRTDGEFMAVIRDDRITPEDKLMRYTRLLVGYKFKLVRRPDFVKASLFKKMLDDNAAQFLDIFVTAIPEAEDQGLTFDFGSAENNPVVLHDIGEELKYNGWLPVYSFAAACGKFGAEEAVECDGWIDVSAAGVGHLTDKMYVVRAKGHSMEPQITDGQYCVFEYREGTFDPNDIVLAQHTPVQDDETQGAYSIKKIVVERRESEEAETPQNVSVVLKPLNRDPKYGPIVLPDLGEFGNDYKIVGVLRKVL